LFAAIKFETVGYKEDLPPGYLSGVYVVDTEASLLFCGAFIVAYFNTSDGTEKSRVPGKYMQW
jgi:hypothetical protein